MKKLMIILYITLFSACLFDNSFQRIVDDFEVGYVNISTYRNIYYNSQGIFDNYVFGVGWNDKYIIVETHPFRNDSKSQINQTKTEYFIINVNLYKKEPFQMESRGVIGPLNQSQFKDQQNNLQIEDVDFQLNY